ncbi:efflux RND transporter permease subunit [Marinococcus luteus]|uniref:efflux RND transporter permease subunit n=1 Tax=Marinococcus luteus TaxID=1122204 RepID=UPI002ACC7391|nr:efflux RND transporter permease subunit [Marinococcus luteus]MDZ5784303.1 efflux RND transporter permease subunit [Marinococcus luteus]
MKITRTSIRRPKLTIVGMILFIMMGFVSLTNLPLQLFPEIEPPVAAVATNYEGAGPEEIETSVTEPMEEQLSTIEGLDRMTSQSEEGSSLVLLELSWSTSVEDVEQEINNAMNNANLPDDAGDPSFIEFDPDAQGMIQMAAYSEGNGLAETQSQVEDMVTELERTEGVASVDTSGGLSEEFQISLDQESLEDNNVTQSDVTNAVQANNITQPGGTITSGDQTLTTRTVNELGGVEDLEEVSVGQNESGDTVTVGDVGEVERTTEEQTAYTEVNQEPGIQMTVLKESDANTAQVSTDFNETLDDLLEEDQYNDLDTTMIYDEGDYVQQSINSVALALIAGGVFAMVVLFFFLRNLTTPLIIGIAIPFSVIVTFAFLYFTNVSLNLMTMGGLALGIGMLVDNAIVVIENIYRHLSMKKLPKRAALDGTKEVAGAITASTLTTVAVFLPIVFISGIVGEIFQAFALSVAFSLLASLLVAVTVVPMIASRVLKPLPEDREVKREKSRPMRFLDRSIRWVLGHRAVALLLTLVLLLGGAGGIAQTGVNFIPTTDQGFFTIDVEKENGTNLETTGETVDEIESVLEDQDEIASYMAVVGSGGSGVAAGGGGGGSSGSNEASITVTMEDLEDRDISTEEMIEEIESDVENTDEQADISLSSSAAIGGGEANSVEFTLSNENEERLEEDANEVQSELESENTIRNVETSDEETAPEIQVQINEDEAQDNGLTPAEIAETVNSTTSGEVASTIQTDNEGALNVNVQYAEDSLENQDDLESLQLATPEGEYVSLSDVADIEEGEGPAVINRLDQERSTEFTVTYGSGTSLNETSTLIEDTIDDVDTGAATTLNFSGEQELLDDSIQSLVFAFLLAVVFIYLVMAGQFESFKYPFVVMFSVPLVVIGVMLALFATQTPLSITVFIGLIVLAGIVVNNAIVLVDYTNQLVERGMPVREAVIESVKKRARPILMTASTTILGVLPLALGFGEGSEIQQPMGIAVIGGLISSTFLTLFIIPTLYTLFTKETRSMNKKFAMPDGGYMYGWEVEERRKEREKREQEEQNNNEDQQKNETTEESKEPENIEDKKREDLSRDEILYLLERIVGNSQNEERDRAPKDTDKNKKPGDNEKN